MSKEFIDRLMLPMFEGSREEMIAKLKEFDFNGDGFVKQEYLKLWFQKELRKQLLEIIGAEIVELMKKSDENGDDEINYVKFARDAKLYYRLESDDFDNDGFIPKEQLVNCLFREGRAYIERKLDAEIDRWIREADKNENGQIDYDKFVIETFETINCVDFFLRDSNREAFPEKVEEIGNSNICRILRVFSGVSLNHKYNEKMKEEKMEQDDAEKVALFKKYDLNGDGFIDKEELKKLLIEKRSDVTDKLVKDLMRWYDCDEDGKISLDEFRSAWCEDFIMTAEERRW